MANHPPHPPPKKKNTSLTPGKHAEQSPNQYSPEMSQWKVCPAINSWPTSLKFFLGPSPTISSTAHKALQPLCQLKIVRRANLPWKLRLNFYRYATELSDQNSTTHHRSITTIHREHTQRQHILKRTTRFIKDLSHTSNILFNVLPCCQA